MKILVIIPTFNERENIKNLINEIFNQGIEGLEILVVDDSSPDATAEIVRQMLSAEPRIHLLCRDRKMGLGTAYIAGFKFALAHHYDLVVEMDADFSHDPKELPDLINGCKEYDLTIGSRYLKGTANVVDWPLSRLILSMGASTYTRLITGMPVHDCTAGFKCFRRQVLESINFNKIQSDGYSFQIEMNYKAWKKGFRIGEISIIFNARRAGTSKMSKKIIGEAIWMVWKLKLSSLFGRLEI